jgi:hypothetical protein
MSNFLKLMTLLGGYQMLKPEDKEVDSSEDIKAMQMAEAAQEKKYLSSPARLDKNMSPEDRELRRRIMEKYGK